MIEPQRPRCPNCQAPNPAGQPYCGRCGTALGRPPSDWVPSSSPDYWASQPAGPSGFHKLAKGLLALWAIAYPIVSCSPLLASGGTAGGTAVTGIAALVVGATLFFPWIVGLLILGILVMLSKGEGRPAGPKPQAGPTNWTP